MTQVHCVSKLMPKGVPRDVHKQASCSRPTPDAPHEPAEDLCSLAHVLGQQLPCLVILLCQVDQDGTCIQGQPCSMGWSLQAIVAAMPSQVQMEPIAMAVGEVSLAATDCKSASCRASRYRV